VHEHVRLEAADAVAVACSRELMSHTEIRERGVLFPVPNCPVGPVDRGRPWGIVRAMAKSPFSLEGKTAIVTGGGTGIGKSIAIEFARAGADVALCSRKLEHLEPVVKAVRDIGKRSFAVAMDVRQEDQVKAVVDRAVQEWGRLDIMVNNAGASFRAKPEDISVNGWNTVVGINLTGAFLGCKWAGRQMMQQPTGGVIVNISSIAGVYGSTMMPHYGPRNPPSSRSRASSAPRGAARASG